MIVMGMSIYSPTPRHEARFNTGQLDNKNIIGVGTRDH
jgi:hypothetical protein